MEHRLAYRPGRLLDHFHDHVGVRDEGGVPGLDARDLRLGAFVHELLLCGRDDEVAVGGDGPRRIDFQAASCSSATVSRYGARRAPRSSEAVSRYTSTPGKSRATYCE